MDHLKRWSLLSLDTIPRLLVLSKSDRIQGMSFFFPRSGPRGFSPSRHDCCGPLSQLGSPAFVSLFFPSCVEDLTFHRRSAGSRTPPEACSLESVYWSCGYVVSGSAWANRLFPSPRPAALKKYFRPFVSVESVFFSVSRWASLINSP